MTLRNPRSRTISIRLSDEEYVRLKRLCAVTGARSVSELTRDAMGVMLEGPNRDDVLTMRMDELRAMLKTLERKMNELSGKLFGDAPEK